MDAAQTRVARAHALGLVGIAVDALLIITAGLLIAFQATRVLTASYWPLIGALGCAALLVGVPAGSLLGWSNQQRKISSP